MRKSLLLTVIVIFSIGLTYGLIQHVGMRGFLFAWSLNLLLMMCVFIFNQTLQSSYSAAYFEEKPWESKGKIYETFGVNLFRKLLVWIGWEKLNKKANPVGITSVALRQLHYRTKQNEMAHIVIFFIVLIFTIYVALTFGLSETIWLIVLNILLNLYPILLQRYNRPRIQRALLLAEFRERRSANFSALKIATN